MRRACCFNEPRTKEAVAPAAYSVPGSFFFARRQTITNLGIEAGSNFPCQDDSNLFQWEWLRNHACSRSPILKFEIRMHLVVLPLVLFWDGGC